MASKRMAPVEAPEEVREEVAEEVPENSAPVSAWDEYVDMYVPKAHKNEDPSIFVEVNGRSSQIPLNGKVQRIRRPWAEILQAHFDAEEASEAYRESIPNDEPMAGSPRVY